LPGQPGGMCNARRDGLARVQLDFQGRKLTCPVVTTATDEPLVAHLGAGR
jgi:methenyltetrahydromethanopterin cyclohydrolase